MPYVQPYSQAFEDAVDHLMLYEVGGFWNINNPGARDGSNARNSGYVNDPDDRGGETKYGISANANPDVDIFRLDWEGAKRIYFERYWVAGSCDKLPGRIAVLHFDGCANIGISKASKILQNAINVTVDGVIGQETLDIVEIYDQIEVCQAICAQRAQYYRNIVARNPSQGKFLNGWLRRISEVEQFVTNPGIDFQN